MTKSYITPQPSRPGRKRRPELNEAAFEVITRLLETKRYWCPAAICAELGAPWNPEDLEMHSRRWHRLKRLRRRAESASAAALSEVVLERGLAGDKAAAMSALKNLHAWTPGRDAGGGKLSEPQRAGLAVFADLGEDD